MPHKDVGFRVGTAAKVDCLGSIRRDDESLVAAQQG